MRTYSFLDLLKSSDSDVKKLAKELQSDAIKLNRVVSSESSHLSVALQREKNEKVALLDIINDLRCRLDHVVQDVEGN